MLVKSFTNTGDKSYDYLDSSLSIFLESALRKIPFITLTENQKNQLTDGVILNNYLSGLKGTSIKDKPVVYIKSKLMLSTNRGEYEALPFTVYFEGRYKVENGKIFLKIFRASRFISFDNSEYSIEANLENLIQHPEIYFLPYIKSILNYTVFDVSILVSPVKSIISIDGQMAGIGNAKNILLTAGSHRLHVHLDGFRDYDEIISVFKGGYKKRITLDSLKSKKYINIITKPPGAIVYLNEKYGGTTPIVVNVSSIDDVITVTKEGYPDRVIYPSEYLNKSQLNINLSSNWQIRQKNQLAYRYKKRSNLLYYSGIGLVAATVFMGTEATLYKQEAQLYMGTDQARYDDAKRKKNLYSSLTVISSFSSVLVFTFSFKEILNYFKGYEAGE